MSLTRNEWMTFVVHYLFFFQVEDGILDVAVTGVQTCALPIWSDAGPLGSAHRGLRGGRRSPPGRPRSPGAAECPSRRRPECASRARVPSAPAAGRGTSDRTR